MSARLFAGIRFFFVKYVRNKLNAFFLDPMYICPSPPPRPSVLCVSRNHICVAHTGFRGWAVR
jgi:hypothetical protein